MVVLAVLFLALGARVVQLQIVDPDRYVALAADQTVRTQVLAADRGAIYDRDHVEMAISRPVPTLYTDPKFVDDPQEAAEQLAPVLGIDAAELESKLGADTRFAYLARQVDEETAAAVDALEIPGVYVFEEPKRFVPGGSLARSLIGRTDIDNVGIGGLEEQYEETLAGTPGELTLEQDPAGRTIPYGEHQLTPAVKGDDLVLTLDRSMQFEAERVLIDQVRAAGAAGGVVVVSSPSTGEILAIANVETDPESGEPAVSTNNLALTTVYEPGSVMKLVTMSTGIEAGVVDPAECIPVPDALQIADKTFTEYKPHGGGCWLPEDVIARSSNNGSINVGLRLGKQRLYDGFKAFNLGEPSGLGFPYEQAGYVRPVEEWWDTSLGSMAIGQGISVTPMQMLYAFNTIANDGAYIPPKLVHSTIDAESVEHLTPTDASHRVTSPETADQMTAMLAKVVREGTAKSAQLDGYEACGKTGTALKPFNGGYTGPDGASHYNATFVGFFPCEAPQISIITVIDDPRGAAYTGGAVAAPVFKQLADFAIRHYDIAPSAPPEAEGQPAPSEGGPVQAIAASTVPPPADTGDGH